MGCSAYIDVQHMLLNQPIDLGSDGFVIRGMILLGRSHPKDVM